LLNKITNWSFEMNPNNTTFNLLAKIFVMMLQTTLHNEISL